MEIEASESLKRLKNSLEQISSSYNSTFAELYSGPNYILLESAKAQIERIRDTLVSNISVASMSLTPTLEEARRSIVSNAFSAIYASLPYIDDEQQDIVEEILPTLETNAKFEWTFDKVVALLSLLVSILSFIVQGLPDEQLDQIIQQQNEIIELHEDNQELTLIVEKLTNCISSLSDEIKSLHNQLEQIEDVDNSHGNSKATNSQEQNGNTQ